MRDRYYKWWVVGMLWFVCLFNYADRQAIFSVFPLLRTEMGLTDFQLGIVAGAFMWVYALALPLAGIIGDRFSRKTLILGGLIFWSLITIATALATEYWHLVAFRALEGFGEAFYFPASMSLLSDYHGKETRSRAMALHQSSVYAGTIAGGTLAGLMADYYGWRSGFYVFGILGVILGLILFFFLREPPRRQAEEGEEEPRPTGGDSLGQTLLGLARNPYYWLLILVFGGANFVASIFLSWMPTYLYDTFGMSLSLAGYSATAYLQIASILGVILGGYIADYLARRFRFGRMATQALGLLAGAPFIFLTGWTFSIPNLVFAMAGFGLFKGFYDANIWASLYDVVGLRERATALGFMNSLGWFLGAMAPMTIALAAQYFGMSACLSATSLIYLVMGLILVFALVLGSWHGARPRDPATPGGP